jgi:thymidine kinase
MNLVYYMNFSPGSIQLFIGPMFSGKTSTMIEAVKREGIAGRRCLLVKFQRDNRYDPDIIVTHSGHRSSLPTVQSLRLSEVPMDSDPEVIGIDEGQFYPDLVEYCDRWANEGKLVVVAGLDGDFRRQPFTSIAQLVPRAEHVTKLNAVCLRCRRRGVIGAFSALIRQKPTPETEITVDLAESNPEKDNPELIGGLDQYVSCCRECFQASGGNKK